MNLEHRFDGRVKDYLRARPGYPRQVLDVIRAAMGEPEPKTLSDWRLSWTVADMGAGTGLMSVPFLEAGCTVYGVEPNDEMRAVAARTLARFGCFSPCAGRAEDSGLDTASVDLVVAGQAFHWFDVTAAVAEWRRILRATGRVALVWNRRRATGTAFLVAYETFLRSWGQDYEVVSSTYEDAASLAAVFKGVPEPILLPHTQRLDREGLRARLRSCSYLPDVGHPDHEPMIRAASGLFDAHQMNGFVHLLYDAVVYAGEISPRMGSQPGH